MSRRQHVIKTAARIGRLVVEERKREVRLTLRFDRYGDFGDLGEVVAALAPLVARYAYDPRPIRLDAPDLGHLTTVEDVPGGYAVTAEDTRGTVQ